MKTVHLIHDHPKKRRILDSVTLESLGLSVHDTLVWDAKNHHCVTLSNANAELLVAKLPLEFELATDQPEEPVEEEAKEPLPDDVTDDESPDEGDDEEDDN